MASQYGPRRGRSPAPSGTTPPATIRRSVGFLAHLAQLLDIPVTASAAPRPGGPAVVEEASIPGMPIFIRNGPCAWDDAATRQAITAQPHRENLAICGVTSEIVVLHTALDAITAGFEVSVLLDACGGLSPPHRAGRLPSDRGSRRPDHQRLHLRHRPGTRLHHPDGPRGHRGPARPDPAACG
ncbi:isochorismatase family protein [Streptomyces avermitilis]|uniref:isochorismatase family protein n=1 Tax=Streptomyces avermitilis TaxID=33903 RepID=UPI0033CDB236